MAISLILPLIKMELWEESPYLLACLQMLLWRLHARDLIAKIWEEKANKLGDNRLETAVWGQENPFPETLQAITLQLGYFYVLFYSSFQFHFIYLEEIEGSLPKEGSVRKGALKWREIVMMVVQPWEWGPEAVIQLGLGQCTWQPGSTGHTLPCSWHILEAGIRVSGKASVTGGGEQLEQPL